MRKFLPCVFLIAALMFLTAVHAEEPAKNPQAIPAPVVPARPAVPAAPGPVTKPADEIETITVSDDNNSLIILQLLERLNNLENEVNTLRMKAEQPRLEPVSGSQPYSAQDDEERKAQTALERTIIDRGGLLLAPWTLEVAPGFMYTHSSVDAISVNGFTILPILVVGNIVSERVRRDMYTPSLTLRLGLPKDFQFEAYVPYAFVTMRTVTAENKEAIQRAEGLGDVEAAITWQAIREMDWVPDLLFGVRWKTTSGRSPFHLPNGLIIGTGFNGVQGSMTAVRIRDPIALFGAVSYTANLPANEPPGRVDPGDTIGFDLGMALSLNPDVSVNIGWDQKFTEETKVNNNKIPGSSVNAGVFRIGSSYVMANWLSLDISLGVGLTQDAPDFQATVTLPFRYQF